MFRRCPSILIVLLLATLSAGATELAGNEIVIPVVGRGPGAYGSEWRTDVVVTHVVRRQIELPAHVTVTLSRSGAPDQSVSFVLDPQASVSLDDVLLETFGIAAGGGMLRVTTPSPASKIAARARIYNVGSQAGEYGVVVAGVPAAELSRVQLLPALRRGAATRTNLGVANPTATPALVTITLFEELTGEQRVSFTFVIAPRSVWRWDDIFAAQLTTPDAVTLHVFSTAPVYAFASVVSNVSGDADFITGTAVPEAP